MNLTCAHTACDNFAAHTSEITTNLSYEHRYGLVVRRTFLEFAVCEKPSGAVRRVRSVGDRSDPAAYGPVTPKSKDLIKFELPSIAKKALPTASWDDAKTSTPMSSIAWSSFSDDEGSTQCDAGWSSAHSEDADHVRSFSMGERTSSAIQIEEDDSDAAWGPPRIQADKATPPKVAAHLSTQTPAMSKRGFACNLAHNVDGHDSHAPAIQDPGLCHVAKRLSSGTTVMVQNLPQEMSQLEFCNVVGKLGFQDSHDFLYMPTCLSTKKTLTYAFVNLLSPELAIDFARQLNVEGIRWSRARVQGLEGNLSDVRKKTRNIRNATFLPIVRR